MMTQCRTLSLRPFRRQSFASFSIAFLAIFIGATISPTGMGAADSARHSTDEAQSTPSQATALPGKAAAEPQHWVNNHECDPPGGVYDVNKNSPGDYSATPAGLMQFLQDWAKASNQSWHLSIKAGTVIHGSADTAWSDLWYPAPGGSQRAVIVWPIKEGNVTKCAVVESSTPLAAGRTVCSGGTTDGTSGAGDHGIRNPGCDAHYKNPDGSVGTNDKSRMWTLQIDSWGSTTYPMAAPRGSNHIVFRDIEITEAPGSNPSRNGAVDNKFVVMDGHDEGIDRFYIHGWDLGDPGQPSGPCEFWTLKGKVSVSAGSTNVTWAAGPQFGAPFNPATSSINDHAYRPGRTIVIGGASYTIASVPNLTSLTLTSGYQGPSSKGVPFAFPATQWFPYEGASGCGDDSGGAILWNGQNLWIMNGYIEKIHGFGKETQAIGGGRDFGPVKIVHNWVEGASESSFMGGFPVQNCMVGGAIVPVNQCTIGGNPDVGPPADIEIRRNRFTKDANWRWLTSNNYTSPGPGNTDGGQGCNFTGARGAPAGFVNRTDCPFRWDVKNDFEIKLGNRVLADGNIFENNWPDAQVGGQIALNPRTCSGGTACGQFDSKKTPVTFVNDIRMTNSIFRNATYTDNPGARSGSRGNGGGVSQGGSRWYWVNNLFYEIGDTANWGGTNGTFDQGAAMHWGVSGGNPFPDCAMSTVNGISTANCPNPPETIRYKSLTHSGTTVTMNMGVRLDPVIGSQITIADESSDPAYNGNWKIASQTSPAVGYEPSIITFRVNSEPREDCLTPHACTGSITFISNAYSQTNIAPGDYVLVNKCMNPDGSIHPPAAEYNSPAAPTQIVACEGSDCPANDPTSLVVRFRNPNKLANDNSGVTCTINNKRGWQKNETFAHNTVAGVDVQNFFDPAAFPQNATIRDNIFGYATGANFYCRSGKGGEAINCLDTNTLTFHHNVLPGTSSSDWVVYPHNAAGRFCAGQGSVGLCFPAAVSCRAASPPTNSAGDPTCIGWTGFMNGTTYPPSPANFLSPPYGNFDYHAFVLHAGSPYKSGHLDQGSDGRDVGADISGIDNALNRTQYVCDNSNECTQNGRVHGPYHD